MPSLSLPQSQALHHGALSGDNAAAGYPKVLSGPKPGHAADAPIVITFNEPVQLGTGTLKLRSIDSVVVSESLAGNPNVKVVGDTLIYTPPQRLAYASDYTLVISPGAILDLDGNAALSGDELYFVFSSGLSPVAMDFTGNQTSERIDGSDLADRIDGAGGEDTIHGWGGNDQISGGDEDASIPYYGDDIWGGDGNDIIEGKGGNDTLSGEAGNDKLYGGTGNDGLRGDGGDDLLDGGDGDDSLWENGGDNRMLGRAGNDRLTSEGWTARGLMDGGDGDDILSGAAGLEYLGGAGDDIIRVNLSANAATTTTIRGGDGADRIYLDIHYESRDKATVGGGAGSDLFVLKSDGGKGIDRDLTLSDFRAGPGGDMLDIRELWPFQNSGNPFEDGRLRLVASGADTLMQMRDSSQAYFTLLRLAGVTPAQLDSTNFLGGYAPQGGSAGLTLTGTAGNDTLRGGGLDDTLLGLGGNDMLAGGAGNDTLDGGDGDDTLYGDGGNNILRGGQGRDKLYALELGDNLMDGGAGDDILAGGQGSDTLLGGDGDDSLSVGGGAPGTHKLTLDGGAGKDTLTIGKVAGAESIKASGGAGADVFVLSAPDNKVTITDFSDEDRLDLRPLLSSGMSGNPFGPKGFLRLVQDGTATRIEFDYDGAGGAHGFLRVATLEHIAPGALGSQHFVGGYDPSGASGGLRLTGSAGDDILTGDALDDIIDGGDGQDRITGRGGDDILNGGDETVLGAGDTVSGGAGKDLIHGGGGADQLQGDEGDDQLYGDAGNDGLLGGEGNDLLEGGNGDDNLSDNSGANILRGGAGNDAISDLGYSGYVTGAGSVLDGGDGDDIIEAGAASVRRVLGGSGNDRIHIGTSYLLETAAMEIDAGAGDDSLVFQGHRSQHAVQVLARGGEGIDTYAFRDQDTGIMLTVADFRTGAGGDRVDVYSMLGYPPPQGNPFGQAGYARLVQDGSRVLLQIDADGAAGGGAFANRVVFDNASVSAFTGANFTGGAQPDGSALGLNLVGGPGNDTLEGGQLDDVLRGGDGKDTLSGKDGKDLLAGENGADRLDGGAGDDQLDGGAGDDELSGGGGNDLLQGGIGNDHLSDLEGDNELAGGDGNDRLTTGSTGHNRLFGGDGDDLLDANGGIALLDGGAGNDTITVYANAYDRAMARHEVRGGAGDDLVRIISSANGNPIDVIAEGGAGSDLYHLQSRLPGGVLTITDFATGAGGDLLDVSAWVGVSGGNPFAPGGNLRMQQRGADAVLQARTAGTATFDDIAVLKNTLVSSLTPANVVHHFNPDGSANGLVASAHPAGQRLVGGWLDDRLDGAAGDDELIGGMGDDTLRGGDGDDLLAGDRVEVDPRAPSSFPWGTRGTGHDRLEGGAGNDTLVSTWGDDVLLGGTGDDSLTVSGHPYPVQGRGQLAQLDGGEGNDRLSVGIGPQTAAAVKLTGGAGSDTFVLTGQPDGSSTVTIEDFRTGAGGDVLDVFGIIRYHQASPFSAGYIRVEQRGADTVVQFDRDAKEAFHGFSDLVTLKNVAISQLTPDNMRYGYLPDTVLKLGVERRAGDGGERLAGTADNDLLVGGAGQDLLSGGAGNDQLLGGAGLDTAIFDGRRADYVLQQITFGTMVADLRGGVHDGVDRVDEVERLRFADGNLALDTEGVAGQAYRIYRAAFDRSPDEGGLGFWIAAMDGGASLATVASGFAGSREFRDLYGSAPANEEIVMRLYQNILHRAPEQAGYDYWLERLTKGETNLTGLLVAFSESIENQNGTAQLIANGIAYQPYGG